MLLICLTASEICNTILLILLKSQSNIQNAVFKYLHSTADLKILTLFIYAISNASVRRHARRIHLLSVSVVDYCVIRVDVRFFRRNQFCSFTLLRNLIHIAGTPTCTADGICEREQKCSEFH